MSYYKVLEPLIDDKVKYKPGDMYKGKNTEALLKSKCLVRVVEKQDKKKVEKKKVVKKKAKKAKK